MEGESVVMFCHIGRGCMPWFIKKLPARVELTRGDKLEVNCIIGESDVQVTRTSEYTRERLIRREAKATIQRGMLNLLISE